MWHTRVTSTFRSVSQEGHHEFEVKLDLIIRPCNPAPDKLSGDWKSLCCLQQSDYLSVAFWSSGFYIFFSICFSSGLILPISFSNYPFPHHLSLLILFWLLIYLKGVLRLTCFVRAIYLVYKTLSWVSTGVFIELSGFILSPYFYVCVWECVCGSICVLGCLHVHHVHTGGQRDQRMALGSLELES